MRNSVLEIQIQSEVNKSVDALRGYVRNYEIFPVFILLKRLNKDFNKIISGSEKQPQIEVYRQLYSTLNTIHPELLEAFRSFEDVFDSHVFVHWPSFFQNINIESLSQEEFEIYFEQSLNISRKKDSYSDYSTPKEIAEFITSVYEIKDNARVFNPFGGNASFANLLPEGVHFAGNEINRKAWALGILNLAAHNRLNNSDFLCRDAFNDSRKEDHYDFVISNLPFGLRTPGTNHFIPNEADGNTIYFALRQISPNGKAVFLTSTGFLSNSNRNAKELRKDLIERGILEYIVLLPSKLFANTSIPSVAIFLNSMPDKKGGVTILDASEFVLSSGKKDKVLDTGRVLDVLLQDGKSNEKRWVPNNEIVEQDYNFNIRRYLLDESSIESEYAVVTLGQIAEERPRERQIDQGTVGKFIRIRDLKNEILDHTIDLSEIEINEIPSHAYEVKYASLLLALRFKTLKPTIIGFSGEKSIVYVSNDILTLKVDQSKIDISYLISELNSDFVLKQVASYQYGAAIPSLRKRDALNLKIRLPDIETQRKIFQDKLEAFYKEKDRELKDFKNQYNLKGDAFKEVASLKHSLGRPLLNIGSGILTLEAYISKLNDSDLQIELKKVIDSIKENISLANNLLEKNENELIIENYNIEEIEIISFFNNYIRSNNNYSFHAKLSFSEEIEKDFEKKLFIKSNSDLLNILMNNIFDNVERHAFKGNKNESNELLIRLDVDLESDTNNVILSIKNNGLPFPENFDKEKFIRKNVKAGETGNTGIGGYDINRIVNFMNGTFDLKLNEEEQYPTNYEITIPIIINKDDEDENI